MGDVNRLTPRCLPGKDDIAYPRPHVQDVCQVGLAEPGTDVYAILFGLCIEISLEIACCGREHKLCGTQAGLDCGVGLGIAVEQILDAPVEFGNVGLHALGVGIGQVHPKLEAVFQYRLDALAESVVLVKAHTADALDIVAVILGGPEFCDGISEGRIGNIVDAKHYNVGGSGDLVDNLLGVGHGCFVGRGNVGFEGARGALLARKGIGIGEYHKSFFEGFCMVISHGFRTVFAHFPHTITTEYQ